MHLYDLFLSPVIKLFVCLLILNPRKMGQIVEKPRGDLEKVLPREDLKPRNVPKANPRAQPKGLPLEYHEAFRFSRGGTFFRYHPRLFHNLSDFGFLEVQGSLPRDHYGNILVNPQ